MAIGVYFRSSCGNAQAAAAIGRFPDVDANHCQLIGVGWVHCNIVGIPSLPLGIVRLGLDAPARTEIRGVAKPAGAVGLRKAITDAGVDDIGTAWRHAQLYLSVKLSGNTGSGLGPGIPSVGSSVQAETSRTEIATPDDHHVRIIWMNEQVSGHHNIVYLTPARSSIGTLKDALGRGRINQVGVGRSNLDRPNAMLLLIRPVETFLPALAAIC